MNPNYNTYMSTIHTPAKRAVEGDIAILFPGELSMLRVQSCLAGFWNKQFDCCTAHLFVDNSVACSERQLLSIEPTEDIEIDERVQMSCDQIESGTFGSEFKQLFKKK